MQYVKAGLSRGWWLAGTLFTFLIISSLTSILQLTLMTAGPQQQPLYQLTPWAFVRAIVVFLLATSMLFIMFSNDLMAGLGVAVNRKTKTIGRMFLYGFGLYLLMMLLAMGLTSIIALILG